MPLNYPVLKELLPYILFTVFTCCLIIQLYYLLISSRHIVFFKPRQHDSALNNDIPVSVIISARSEYENLKKNLPSLLEQDYPDFEVIVVNDRSYDETEFLLEDFEKQYPRLKIVTVTDNEKFRWGKKFALTLGIKAAKNEHLLFTDADCQPATKQWISQMAANFTDGKQIVLGYSPYTKSGSFINVLIRFETVRSAIHYFSAALRGNAYMGIGRNLAYTKTLFFKNKGFAAHMHIMAGDDDLFVNQNATKTNVAIEIGEASHVFTEPKKTFKELFRQKKRHMGVGKFYKASHRMFLSLDALSGLFFYATFIALLCTGYLPEWVLAMFAIRFLVQTFFYAQVFKKLQCADLTIWLLFLDPIYYLYLNFFGLIGTFTKSTQWK